MSARQLEIVRHLPISVVFADYSTKFIDWSSCTLIIDAILGYDLNRKAQGIAAQLIGKINKLHRPVLALATPSGLHTSNGYVSDTVVRAEATLTLALPQKGLLTSAAKKFVGKLYLSDISVPPLLYSQLGVVVDPFYLERTRS